MSHPSRILDLHTHLFNARYVPLASIIADAMGRDESHLATWVAKLLQALTGSSYPAPALPADLMHKDEAEQDEYRLAQIGSIASFELLASTGSLDALTQGASVLAHASMTTRELQSLRQSELLAIIEALSNVDYDAEGWTGALPSSLVEVEPIASLDLSTMQFGSFLDKSEWVVKKAVWVVTKLMQPKAWGKAENYLEFFLTMLMSEESMLEKLVASYGSGLPPLQFSHYMMDMQLAYPLHKPAYYAFHPVQVQNMQNLQRKHAARVFGFCAFDPRRPDWQEHAHVALAKGFKGFKFYPAMGYKPCGNPTDIQQRIDAFFDFCVKENAAVFTHCTPQGFQTRAHDGGNAHPKYWRDVLAAHNGRWSGLRLCLGHAGGGNMENKGVKSPGWMACSNDAWTSEDNFARIVAELCTTYPNVYCEFGYITDLFDEDKRCVFVANIERARQDAREAQRPYDLMGKIAYGSDWHMPDIVDRTREYLEIFLEIMNRDAYKDHLNPFFWQNAYRYLNLPL